MAKKTTNNLSPLYTYQEGMEWNPVEKVIMERRSIRNFKKEPVGDNLIRRTLEVHRHQGSGTDRRNGESDGYAE
jgi:hypothetical protein